MATLSHDVRSGKYPTMHSLLVVRHGYLVFNEYVAGVEPESLQKIQEVSTTITGLLVGMAVDRHKLRAEDGIAQFFTDYWDLTAASPSTGTTVDDFLTMRSVLYFYDEPYQGSPLQALNTHSGDWLRLIFSQILHGEGFMYNSGGIIALGEVLRSVLGETADSFARRELFQPLGIDRTSWFIGAPKGLPHMAAGLSMTSPDMARIGYLMLRDGRWNDAQIVSAGWLARMRERKSPNLFNWATHPVAYGRTLWVLPPIDGVDVFAASGVYGQWIFVVPAKDLVVVSTAHGSLSDFKIPVQLLYDTLIPSSR
jgi:CubicO group peptidase (beta-lactamase class C family)